MKYEKYSLICQIFFLREVGEVLYVEERNSSKAPSWEVRLQVNTDLRDRYLELKNGCKCNSGIEWSGSGVGKLCKGKAVQVSSDRDLELRNGYKGTSGIQWSGSGVSVKS